MNIRPILVTAAVGLAAFSIGRFTGPAKVKTKEVERVVYRDRIIKDIQKDVTTRTKETRLPDGTVTRETVKEDKSQTHKEVARAGARETIKETRQEGRADWKVGAIYKPLVPGYQGEAYGVLVERRLIGEIYVGVTSSTDGTAGLVVSIGF